MTKLIIKSDIENSENFLQYNESINNNDRKWAGNSYSGNS